ncbi:hypothetical protein [Nonomuraea sp. WAC 01424]|uniref:hypothetical protein n=1 Tax=Nonomuraea sp. WAC 01424 TaxID=2203200 RepID=UPI00163C3508|nr:hypothetical protein [Nonomuraea sp. WAC 01424]
MTVALAFAGVFGYLAVNVIVGLLAVSLSSSVAIGAGAGFLLLLGIGTGLTLAILRKPWSFGLGLGLMIGWALATIVSAGYCTGLNPALYA